ncbi:MULTISPECIES: dihydrofolate reductase family protein [unclassified Rathayibacter]|uniref:dihydrofolate reductase family protein n=1 Tax=unclassified Rathayibacter TaxID=2609250 RepID=UPI0006F78978|nr:MULTISPECIES: dihydrofolate reductase family protein [unclassified Rathayibacter]KQQ03652.1 riboflavin biosynthesis protein RibD [Rathayibacter sp. Leaf294]KQS12108.1 riboflavin biosynthesis protein RibD [Rathayibacter sp. Leaf185]
MRELTYFVATSLDGLIAAPDGDWSAFPAEGDHFAAILADYSDTLPVHAQQALGVAADGSRFDTVIMGWRTYTPALDAGIDSPYPHLRQIVATRGGREVPEAVETTADPVATIRELRAADGGGLWLAGGGALAGALIDEIDTLILKVNPVVLGDGVPLFGGAAYAARRFDRAESRQFESGVSIVTHRRVP